MHGLHFLLLQKDSSRISADIFLMTNIYIYIIVICKIFFDRELESLYSKTL